MGKNNKFRHLVFRAYDLYRDLGLSGLFQGIIKYVRHGSFRHDLIGAVPATEHLLRLYIRCGRRFFDSKYTDADPFKIIWVDPNQIEYDISHTDLPRRFGRVCGGNWDIIEQKFSAQTIYQSLKRHFLQDIPWEETQYYKKKYNKLKRGEPTKGCSSVKDLQTYFSNIDELYENIINEGYQTQQMLQSKKLEETTRKNLDAPTASMNEIGISIGRNGTLFHHYRGVHRLTIAKIAEIDRVPVQVLVRHKQWQSVRNKIKETQSNIDFVPDLNHPDLKDIL